MSDPKDIRGNESPESEPGYERRDMDPGAVAMLGAGLVLGLGFITLTTALLYQCLSIRTQREEGAILAPIQPREPMFPPPQLQTDPSADLARLRRHEDAMLNEYRWIDRKAGIVAIPVDRAMELLIQRGEPLVGRPERPPGPTWVEMMQRRALDTTPNRGNSP